MAGSDEDHGRSRRPGAKDWDGRTCQVTLCAVCTMHEEMRSTSFLVEPQNQG
jgi:hypothetical protein